MIRLIKNLWKCFVRGEKAPRNAARNIKWNRVVTKEWDKQTALQEGMDHKGSLKCAAFKGISEHALHAAHLNAFKSTLNKRGRGVLEGQNSMSYSQLSYMSIDTLVQLEGCGIKTAEHIHQSLQAYMEQYDQEMSYINAVTGGDSEFDSL